MAGAAGKTIPCLWAPRTTLSTRPDYGALDRPSGLNCGHGDSDMNAADLVFGVCLLVGGGLLLLTLIVDDIFGGILGALHLGFDVAGVSPTPLLFWFLAMSNSGGLFGRYSIYARLL